MATEKLYSTGPITYLIRQISALQHFRDQNMDRFETLTEREVEILALIAKGMKNPAVAKELDISRVTVQNHRARIRDKLNVSNQTEYIKYALAYDLIQL